MSGVNIFSFQEKKRRQIGAECKRFRKSVLQIGGYTDLFLSLDFANHWCVSLGGFASMSLHFISA